MTPRGSDQGPKFEFRRPPLSARFHFHLPFGRFGRTPHAAVRQAACWQVRRGQVIVHKSPCCRHHQHCSDAAFLRFPRKSTDFLRISWISGISHFIIFTTPSVSTLSVLTVANSIQLLSTCRPCPWPAGEPGRARIVRFSRPARPAAGTRTHGGDKRQTQRDRCNAP